MPVNQAAIDCGQLAQRLHNGYFSHKVAIQIAKHPRAKSLAPAIEEGQSVPIGRLAHKNGPATTYHFLHYLQAAGADPHLSEELDRVWLTSAVLAVGDALSVHSYFDHAPELEFLRHLRNGIAHGNRFNLTNPGQLLKYPAHTRLLWTKADSDPGFEIDQSLQGRPVLFDFMMPGDVVALLAGVSVYLIRMGNGDPLRP